MGVSAILHLLRDGWRAPQQSLTVEQVRSELSHECAAKIGRMLAILRAWEGCDLHDSDREQFAQLIASVQMIHLRYARIALRHPRAVRPYVASLATCRRLRRQLEATAAAPLPSGVLVRSMIATVDALRSHAQAVAHEITRAHGVPLRDVVADAVIALKSEYPHEPAIVFHAEENSGRMLVAREDARRWGDVLINLMRNAAEAVRERMAAPEPSATDTGVGVAIELRRHTAAAGAVLEITDSGLGMRAEQVPTMWCAGTSRHGQSRGQGLTEEKHAFVVERAALSVRPSRGVGTSIRLEIVPRDIAVDEPLRASSRRSRALLWIVTCASLAAMGIVTWGHTWGPVDIVRVVSEGDDLRALGRNSRELWRATLGGPMLRNDRARRQDIAHDSSLVDDPLVIRDDKGRGVGVILATGTGSAPAELYRLSQRGRTLWRRTLAWEPPDAPGIVPLTAVAEMPLRWGREGGADAIAVNVRRGYGASTAIEFFSWEGESLAAYYHPGTLEYEATGDLDGDGAEELLLSGKNNDAPEALGYRDAHADFHPDCLVLLGNGRVNGQAFPYQRWSRLGPSAEEGYLVIPPLTRAQVETSRNVAGFHPKVVRVQAMPPSAQSAGGIQVTIDDGRIYLCDSHLRPLRCTTGDNTYARRLRPAQPLAPCVYVQRGRVEKLAVEVQ